MQIDARAIALSSSRYFPALRRCPVCDDLMIAPVSSEFVAKGEIRHRWECEACGETVSVSIPITKS